ncbi:hypothetical protein Pcinc_021747 [Petrolisthes cinctipes]|uniref:Uncharacterized protein n=1 Tax=Petrolisthes cinctipes TaxID=88211 RepID=A0AAE1FGS1_PETCI|nr:hypothetical protein Pcinc_021747 [Petrolisthes cinctipes]
MASSMILLVLGVVIWCCCCCGGGVGGSLVVNALPEHDDDESNNFSYNTNSALNWLHDMLPGSNVAHSRKKRYLGFPQGSNLEVKWSLNFPFDTFTFYNAKFQLSLPIKIPFPEAFLVGGGKKEHHKRSVDEEENVEKMSPAAEGPSTSLQAYYNDRRAARQERSSVYTYLETAFEKAGVDGRGCLLRAICDVGEAPFDQGLLGEMINTLLSASLAGRPDDPSEGTEYDRFIEAELHGKLNGKCEERYNKCKTSPFDLFPDFVHSVG